ncbi:MAG: hypothetical protein OEY51_11780, partial [Cyclobacteriaceae bacterium]|nr:hypothetical protein [Cyclobacteriaceae bacterium]
SDVGQLGMLGTDNAGNLMFTETNAGQHLLRIVDTKGNLQVYAGTGTAGLVNSGVILAQFNRPMGSFFDVKRNILFVADQSNNVIRAISSTNNVTTFAGGAGGTAAGFVNGDGQKIALFSGPIDVVVDTKGNVFVSDVANNAIRKIDALGIVTTFVGGNKAGGFADGKGTAALFNAPYGMCIDALDNIYVADLGNHVIRKIDPNGIVTTVAGTGVAGYLDGTVTTAQFNMPTDVDIDNLGNLYVADYSNHLIRILEGDGQVKTYAGSFMKGADGLPAGGFLDGNANQARFFYPISVKAMDSKTLMVNDLANFRIRMIIR